MLRSSTGLNNIYSHPSIEESCCFFIVSVGNMLGFSNLCIETYVARFCGPEAFFLVQVVFIYRVLQPNGIVAGR